MHHLLLVLRTVVAKSSEIKIMDHAAMAILIGKVINLNLFILILIVRISFERAPGKNLDFNIFLTCDYAKNSKFGKHYFSFTSVL